jgi:cellulose synthase/poly-beta-1,6-N-acetylglucosamine synthase-like glycosyltransferase
MSAYPTLSAGQVRLLIAVAAGVALAFVSMPGPTLVAAFSLATVLYLVTFVYRLHLVRTALGGLELVSVSDEDAQAIPESELPIYTVLVPAYREAEVISQTIHALDQLDYPRDRLDIKLLLEADDLDTIEAARNACGALAFEMVRVPAGQPRTKPKACNYGLSLARGDLVTIYDAEDRPEPLQLRRAAAAFQRLPREVACLQAKLTYHNGEQNLITRWFTVEYASWFSMMLPAVAMLGGPVPLGGTSMHIRRPLLEQVGAWDAFNVTEDADLGVRLQRLGYQVAVLDSTTTEEANSDFINWVKQRSRWYKGYLQTWLVHMRHPVELWRQLGPGGFLRVNLLLGAVPVVALINPIFWLLTGLWFLARPGFLEAWLPPAVYYASLFSMIVGNFLALYLGLIAVRATRHPRLVWAALVSPLYWAMMSVAAVRAILQLVVDPYFWEKSVHGLDRRLDAKEASLDASS